MAESPAKRLRKSGFRIQWSRAWTNRRPGIPWLFLW